MAIKSVVGADPYVMKDPVSGHYYCYCTGNSDETPFYIYQGDDLLHWKEVGYGLDRSKNDWGRGWFWAPEVYYNPNNGYYYMFYSSLVRKDLVDEYFGDENFEECCKIGVAVSKSPKGPFVNIENHPMDYYPYDETYRNIDAVAKDPFSKESGEIKADTLPEGVYIPTIDADFFIDDDKRMYLYFSRCCYRNCLYDPSLHKYVEESNILGVELDPSFWYDKEAKIQPRPTKEYIHVDENGKRKDKYVQIISYHQEPQQWENGHVFDYENSSHVKHNRRWSEGSMTIRRHLDGKDKYLLFYSSNNYENALYGVGASFGDKPLEHYSKYVNNPIIHQIPDFPLYSTGHGCVIEKDNETYYFFHGRENCAETRTCYFAKLHIDSLNEIYVSDIKHCELNETER